MRIKNIRNFSNAKRLIINIQINLYMIKIKFPAVACKKFRYISSKDTFFKNG